MRSDDCRLEIDSSPLHPVVSGEKKTDRSERSVGDAEGGHPMARLDELCHCCAEATILTVLLRANCQERNGSKLALDQSLVLAPVPAAHRA